MSGDGISKELINDFLVESYEGLQTISDGLTSLEKNPDDVDLLNEIYRAMHTMKGAANFLHFEKLQLVTHSAESLLDLLRENKMNVTPQVIDVMLESTDIVSSLLKNIEADGSEGGVDPQAVNDKIVALMIDNNNPEEAAAPEAAPAPVEASPPAPAAPEPTPVAAPDPTPAPAATVNEPKAETPKPAPKKAAPKKTDKAAGLGGGISDSVVRVNVHLLDKIMNVVGELVLTRNQILQFSGSREIPELAKLASQLNLITTELQSDVMTTRMQPIGNVLGKFDRLIRDLGRETGKQIEVEIEGKETELDKTLLEAIKDPLTHLVRNAVDHGVETPAERKDSGKSSNGNISIRAFHESGQVTVEIQDDGRGINREKVTAKAMEKGLITQEEAVAFSDKQVSRLIFAPGFSTAEKVTNISGRGVGMDVVKNNIEKIGGTVDVASVFGNGTTFRLKIPLTLAIIPALIVKVSSEFFAIPQVNLVELVRLEAERNERIETIQNSEFLRLRGELVPLIRIEKILNLERQAKEEVMDNELTGDLSEIEGVENIAILNTEGKVFGLIVDSILDTQEIVVKPLGTSLKKLSIYAGATIMGDGRVALILDGIGLANFSQLMVDKRNSKLLHQEKKFKEGDRHDLLMFSLDSDSAYAVSISLVNRLEEFHAKDMEYVGKELVIRYRETVMPLIDLNVFLGLKEKSEFTGLVNVLVMMESEKYFGIIVNDIKDIAVSDGPISQNIIDQKGVMGTTFVSERTVTVVDVYQVLDSNALYRQLIDSQKVEKEENDGKRILVVDDSPLIRTMETRILGDEGYEVICAENGEEALKLLRKEKVDMVLSDIEMPVMTGLELAREIRKDDNLKHLPLVALTTKFGEADQEKGYAAGFEKYLEKLKQDEIKSVVSEMIHRNS